MLTSLKAFCPLLHDTCSRFGTIGSASMNSTCGLGVDMCRDFASSQANGADQYMGAILAGTVIFCMFVSCAGMIWRDLCTLFHLTCCRLSSVAQSFRKMLKRLVEFKHHFWSSEAAQRWNRVLRDTRSRTTGSFFARRFYFCGDRKHAKLLLKCLKAFQTTGTLPWDRVCIEEHILTVTPHPTFSENARCFETLTETPDTALAIFLYALGCLRNGHYDPECIALLKELKGRQELPVQVDAPVANVGQADGSGCAADVSRARKAWEKVLANISEKSDNCFFAENLYNNGDFAHGYLLLKCLAKFQDAQMIAALPWERVFLNDAWFHVVAKDSDLDTDWSELMSFKETHFTARTIFLYALGCLRKCCQYAEVNPKCLKILKVLKSRCLSAKPETLETPPQETEKAPAVEQSLASAPETADSVTPQPLASKAQQCWNLVLADVAQRSTYTFFAENLYRQGDTVHAKLLLACLLKFRDHRNLNLAWDRVDLSTNTAIPDPCFGNSFHHGRLMEFEETPDFARCVFLYALGCLRNNCCDAECAQMLRTLKLLCSFDLEPTSLCSAQ